MQPGLEFNLNLKARRWERERERERAAPQKKLHGTLAKHAETTLIRSRMSVIFHDRLPDLLMKKVPLSTRARSKSSESHNWRKCRQIGPDSGGSQICFWQTGRRQTGKCSTHRRRSLSQRTHQKSTHKRISLSQKESPEVYTQKISHTEQHKSATKRQERKKERKHYFNLTQGTRTLTQLAHTKHNQQMKDLRFCATTSKLLFFFGSVNNSHVPKTKS
jgi:hypothetical protein